MSDTVNDIPNQSGELAILTVGIIGFAAIVSLACLCGKKRREEQLRRRAQQEQNIYNISGRVPNTNANQYPDAYLSVQHIAITNELNKPPKYDDAPPSYEDAIKMAIAQSNSLQTLQAEQTLRQEGTSSNSSSTPAVAAPAVACPAVLNQTTE